MTDAPAPDLPWVLEIGRIWLQGDGSAARARVEAAIERDGLAAATTWLLRLCAAVDLPDAELLAAAIAIYPLLAPRDRRVALGCRMRLAGWAAVHGVDYLRSDRLEPAIRLMQCAVELGEDEPNLFYDLGLAYANSCQFESAELWYRKTLAADPAHRPAGCGLALLLAGLERFEEAAELLTSAYARWSDEDRAASHLACAELLHRCGKFAAAAAQFELYGKANPASPEAARDAATGLARSAEIDGAITLLRPWLDEPVLGSTCLILQYLRERLAALATDARVGGIKPDLLILAMMWGPEYVESFQRLALPSALAEGNLPALLKGRSGLLRLFTNEAGWARLSSSASIAALGRLLAIEPVILPEAVERAGAVNVHLLIGALATSALTEARAMGADWLFLLSDTLLADGSLAFVAQAITEGYEAVAHPPIGAIAAPVEEAVQSFRGPDGILRIPSRKLAQLALDHLHPRYCAIIVDPDAPPHLDNYSQLIFPASAGLSVRCFTPVPAYLAHAALARAPFFDTRPTDAFLLNLTFPEAQCWGAIRFPSHSDEFLAVDLAGAGEMAGTKDVNFATSVQRWSHALLMNGIFRYAFARDFLIQGDSRRFGQPAPGLQAEIESKLAEGRPRQP